MDERRIIADLEWALGDGSFPLMQAGNWPNFPANFQHQNENQNQVNAFPEPEPKRKKRFRTIFTPYQLGVLEREFRISQYLDRVRRSQLAKHLALSDRQIKVWFQNRRTKLKRSLKENSEKVHQPADQMIAANMTEQNRSYPMQNTNNYNFPQPQNQPTYQPPSCMYADRWNPSYW